VVKARAPGSPLPDWEWVQNDTAKVEVFDCGSRLTFGKKNFTAPPEDVRRGLVLDQSNASRHRLAFALGNASDGAQPLTWLAMTTATWREPPETREEVLDCKAKLARFWLDRWGQSVDAWVMEMQARGVPHLHLLHACPSAAGLAIANGRTEEIVRRGKVRRIVRGGFDHWFVDTWCRVIGDRSAPTLAFQRGGTTELFDGPDGAGRYFAKECSKREQKQLPDRYKAGLGRWWWLAPRWQPQCRAAHQISLDHWPYEQPVKHIWQSASISDCQKVEPATGRCYVVLRDARSRFFAAPSDVQFNLPLSGGGGTRGL